MRFIIEDPFLGKREIGSCSEFIRDQLSLLEHFEKNGTSPNPEKLKDDIYAYKCLLSTEDFEKACEQYQETMGRYRENGEYKTKKEVTMELGYWK